MAFHGKFTDALIAVGKHNLSGVSNEISLSAGIEALDSTCFGDTARRRLASITDAKISGAGIYDATLLDLPMFTAIGETDDNASVITLAPSKADAQVAYISKSCAYQWQPGASHGELLQGSFALSAKDILVRGQLGEIGTTARTASGNGSALSLGAVSASQSLYATLHVVTVSGTTPTLDVIIQSDDGSGFASPTSRITFAQMTAAGSKWGSAAGAITDTFFRVNYTIGGTGPSFTFIVGIGIA